MKSAKSILALSPLVVFLGLYVVISLIIGDFYKIPLTVALLVASLWALVIYRDVPFQERIEAFSKEAGNSNVLYMVWIFILAGCFATLADKTGAVESTVALTINQLPSTFVMPGLFMAACFISMAIGTSVGTVVALVPLAVNYASNVGGDIPFFVAIVLGGSFFGDNLSFISDTTIAATRTQGCNMSEKFRANFLLALPAAIITLAIYILGDFPIPESSHEIPANPWLVVPYLAVIVLAISGVNVTITLVTGIVLAFIFALSEGYGIFEILGFMGSGIDGMGNLIIITLMAAGMLGLIKAAGGIHALLNFLSKGVKGIRGAQSIIALLVGIVNLCTANNTVAILTVGSISKNISDKFGIPARRSASLLDTSSCIVQCLIPYGAQTLLATSLAGIAPTAPWKYLFYPWILAGVVAISIIGWNYFYNSNRSKLNKQFK
ncbi:MAG: Na+/H+ antiporter NhaC family protein [Muribaculaceae bacterium]|nr:Na+/H+ antiporter NhaC family protein [Muribaculaceae bacterium]